MAIFSRDVVPAKQARAYVPDRGHGGGKVEPGGLTAAATRINVVERERMRRYIQAWQSLALSYYDAIGEIHYIGQFYSRAMQNVRLFVGVRDENDEIIESKDPKARELLARVHDPGGGRRVMMSRYGQLAFITGESLLMWTDEHEDEDGFHEERWEILSNDELRPEGMTGYVRFRAPGLGGEQVKATPDGEWEPVPNTSIVYRLWTPHPRYSWLADSPMRGVLDLCKELLTLTQAVNAMAISHAARAGIMLVPEELDFPQPEGGTDDDPEVDGFEYNLNQALMAAVKDPSSSAALAPLVIRGASEYLHPDVFRHLSLQDEREKYPEENLRNECIRRIALGVDMPPEELLGKADVNHWGAWEISEDAWRHVEPVAWAFADSLAAAYLRPTARKEGIDGWEKLCIGVDEGAAVVKPDRGGAASEARSAGAVKLETVRAANDFADDDKMDDEEYQTWLAIQMNDPSLLPDKWQPQSFKDAQEAKKKAAENSPFGGSQQPGDPTAEADPNAGENIPRDAPEKTDVSAQRDRLAVSASVDMVMGAAQMAAHRCREKAGSRARTAAQKCESCKDEIKGVPMDAVAATLGADVLVDLGLTDPLALVAGGAESFVAEVVRWGWSETQAKALGEIVEMHAARNLFEETPSAVPAGLAGHVRRGAIE